MLKLLIPIVDHRGAAEAARHSAFMFSEHCVSMVEVVEVVNGTEHEHGRTVHPRSNLHTSDRKWVTSALQQVCAILDDAGVPYRYRRVAGSPERVIAACVESTDSDIVVVDAKKLGFLRKWRMLIKLGRSCAAPLMLLH